MTILMLTVLHYNDYKSIKYFKCSFDINLFHKISEILKIQEKNSK